MRYELLAGLRYTRATVRRGSRNLFIGFSSMVSMIGIALGVWALIVVLSVMNGFQKEVRARILAVVSHVQVTGEGGLADWRSAAGKVAANPHVQASAPYVNAQAIISVGRSVRGAIVRGVLPEAEVRVAEIAQNMRTGRLESLAPGGFGIVLGADLARTLGVIRGDKVVLIAPQGQVTPAGVIPRLKQFTVEGTFEVGMSEYDAGLALVHLEDAQRLYQLGERVTGLRLKLDDVFAARDTARELMAVLDPDLYASDWTRSHANFFRAVEIEKRMMFIILTLIVCVAAFNIVATLVMAVTEKRADIAILRTLGATRGSIMQIFVVQGAVIGVIGTLVGMATGVLTALNIDVIVPAIEQVLGFKFLSKDVYMITDLPSEVRFEDVAWIGAVSLLLAFAAAVPPSWRAARVDPAEALRYE